MPSNSDRQFTPQQRAAIAELLVAVKRFWFASPGPAEQAAVERLSKALDDLAQAID